MKRSHQTIELAAIVFGATIAFAASAGSGNSGEEATRGRTLFERNCAHCHGDDAHGDEGPDLHNLKESDARISKIITQGVKGEMPAFGLKLNEADVKALIAFLRILKD